MTAVIIFAYTIAASAGGISADDAAPQYAYTLDDTDNLSMDYSKVGYAKNYRVTGNIIEFEIDKDLSGMITKEKISSKSLKSLNKSELVDDAVRYNSVSAHFTIDKSTGISDVSLDFNSNDLQIYTEDIRMKAELDSNNSLKSAYIYENNQWEDLSETILSTDELELCVLPFMLIGGLALIDWIILTIGLGITAVAITWKDLCESTDIEAEETGQTKEERKIDSDLGYIIMDGVPKYMYVNGKASEAYVLNDENIYKMKPNEGSFYFVLRYKYDNNNSELYFAPLKITKDKAIGIIGKNKSEFNVWTPHKKDAGDICIHRDIGGFFPGEAEKYLPGECDSTSGSACGKIECGPKKDGYFVHYHRVTNGVIEKAHSFFGLQDGGIYVL